MRNIAPAFFGVAASIPLVTVAGDDSVNAGSAYLLSLAAAGGADVQTATIDWGDGGGPQAIDLTDGVPPLLTHVFNDGGDDDTVIVTATDDNGVTTTVTQPVSVLDVAPTECAPIAPVTADEDRTISGVATTFTDPSSTETQTAMIDWGDGSTASATVDESAGTITLPDHTYTYNGTYYPVLTVTNSGGAATTVPFTVTVGSPRIVLSSADPIAATQGTVYTAPLATFTDAANTMNSTSVYIATVTWNGTQTDPATVRWDATDGYFIVTDPDAPTMSGDVSVRIVIINSTSGEYAALNANAGITDPAPTITTATALSASARTAFSEVLIADFTTTSGDTNSADFSAYLSDTTGDDLTTTVGAYASGEFPVFASGSFEQAGDDQGLSLEVDDNVGGATSSAAIPIPITETTPASPDYVSASLAPDGGGVDLNWDASDGAVSYNVYRSTDGGATFASLTTSITGTGYTDANGTPLDQYYVIAVNDAGQSTASPTTSASSGSDAPVITAAAFSAAARSDVGGTVVATFTDPGGDTNADDFAAFLSDANGDDFTATITLGSGDSLDVVATGDFDISGSQILTVQVQDTALSDAPTPVFYSAIPELPPG